MAHKTDGKLHEQIAYSVMTARLDIDGYRECYKCFPPGMFTNLDALDEWIYDMEHRPQRTIISKQKLDDFACSDALILATQEGAPIHYESVWVRADWERYRDAMKAYLGRNNAGTEGVASVDADHVINRDRVLKNHPNAWLMLMPVPLSSNRAFGSAIEKKLPPIDVNRTSSLIEPFVLLKTFAQKSIKSPSDLQNLAVEIMAQMEDGDTKDATVEAALNEYRALRKWPKP